MKNYFKGEASQTVQAPGRVHILHRKSVDDYEAFFFLAWPTSVPLYLWGAKTLNSHKCFVFNQAGVSQTEWGKHIHTQKRDISHENAWCSDGGLGQLRSWQFTGCHKNVHNPQSLSAPEEEVPRFTQPSSLFWRLWRATSCHRGRSPLPRPPGISPSEEQIIK